MTDYDGPWKEMLDEYFQAFMAFFFPEAYQDIDWARDFESLDKELAQIVRDAELGKRLADKLMKVWRRSGEEQMVMIHTEIQGTSEDLFAKRMYVYNYRTFDRYDRPVVSLAVLSDTRRDWRPNQYGYQLWGCRVGIEFPVVKLRDYRQRWSELEQSDNPFAIVVMAHLQTQATRRNPEARLNEKLRIVRRLYERGYNRQDILNLFRFIDWVLVLPAGLEARFQVELAQFEAERNMPYVTSVERMGIEKGLQQGEATLLRRLLTRRFGPLPEWVEQRLTQSGQADLERWADRVLDAPTLADVFTAEA
jgi:hypothetical protein